MMDEVCILEPGPGRRDPVCENRSALLGPERCPFISREGTTICRQRLLCPMASCPKADFGVAISFRLRGLVGPIGLGCPGCASDLARPQTRETHEVGDVHDT